MGERCQECIKMRTQLQEHGLDTLAELDHLYTEMTMFIRTGDPMSGKIPLPSIDRTLYYQFSNKSHSTSYFKISVTRA